MFTGLVSRHSGILGQETFVQAVPPSHRKHTTKYPIDAQKKSFSFSLKYYLNCSSSQNLRRYLGMRVLVLYICTCVYSVQQKRVHAAIIRVAGITRTRIWGRSVKFKQIIVLTMSVLANKQFDYAVLLSLNMEVVSKIQVLEFC